MKISAYLKLSRHHIYVFRRRIPKNLLEFFETNELRISTRTSDRKKAITLSRNFAIQSDFLYEQLRQALTMSEDDKHLNLKLITNEWLVKHLRTERLEKEEIIEAQQAAFIKQREQLEREHSVELALIQSRHDKLLNINNTLALKRTDGGVNKPEVDFNLSELVEDFFSVESLSIRGDKEATVRKDKDALKLFVEIIGNKLLSKVGQPDAVKFSKSVPLHGRNNGVSRAANTVNGFMNSVSKFSKWIATYHSETGHKKLDFTNLRKAKTKRPSDERQAFTDAEVNAILSHPHMAKFKLKEPVKFWLPYIAAYSGARLEEITQLSPQTDIHEDDGVWVFDINDSSGKSVKNKPSIRKIPIHSELIKQGLLAYVEKIKQDGAEMLFPNEKTRDGRTGKNAGKRVNRFIKNILGVDNKTLHSFRHTFATKLKHAGADEAIAASILGHEHGGITYNRYGKDYLSVTLRTGVEMVNFNF